MFCLIFVSLIVAFSACSTPNSQSTEEKPPVVETPDTETPVEPDPTIDVEPPEELPEIVPPAKEDVIIGSQPAQTQTSDEKPFWQSETTRQTNNLTSIAIAAQADYIANGAKRGWMSKSGKLYSYYTNSNITTAHLVSDGYLQSGLNASEYEIWLINGSDLQGVDGVNVPDEYLGFGVFAATIQSGKYLIACPSGKVGSITSENYTRLLSKYVQNNGTPLRLSSASAEYSRILNFISLYDGKFDNYFVREIWSDGKYAVAVFSSQSDSSKIKQYILRNDSNFWEVVYDNAHEEYYPITMINKKLPDFNVELLPSYTLASWRTNIVSRQSGAIAALFSNRSITSEDDISYMCGTSTCAYVVLKNGNRYAAYQEDGIWKAELVSSDYAAVSFLKNKTGTNYGFLVLDD